MEFDLSEPSYLSVIHLTSDLFSSSTAPRHEPSLVRGHGFIYTRVVPRGRGRGQEGGRGDDASGGFGNGYLPFDG